MSALDVSEWIGRSETLQDHVARGPFDRLAAMLDRAPEAAAIPPMGHLLCFLPGAAQSDIGADGHPRRGGIVPPIDLPMRMAAGSRISFHAPIPSAPISTAYRPSRMSPRRTDAQAASSF